MIDIDKIEFELRGITQGEWRVVPGRNEHWSHIVADVEDVPNLVLADVQNHAHEGRAIKISTNNAQFIANAPRYIQELLSYIADLEGEIKFLEDGL